jgi:hypothetical protein
MQKEDLSIDINIVRIENPTLIELADIAKEILCNTKLPDGSLIMIGSASYLGRCGTSLYACEWTSVVAQLSAQWRGVHVCPLIPLIISKCQGSITREISELSVWYESVYGLTNISYSDAWSAVVESMENASTGTTTCETMDSYKIALPSGLSSKGVDCCITFCTNSSRPIAFDGLSEDNCHELLSTMLNWNFTNFRACASPENYLARATIAEESNSKSGTGMQKVVLVGASNLNRSQSSFVDPSLVFSNKSVAGWTPVPENIRSLSDMIRQQQEQGAKAFVLNIFGNIGVRYEQYDSTTSLPFKSQGKFHLGGKLWSVCLSEQLSLWHRSLKH